MNESLNSRLILICVLSLAIRLHSPAQSNGSGWFHIPGFTPELPTTLTSEETFYGVMGAAILSYTLAEVILKNEENLNFYQVRTGMNNEHVWGLRKVWHQNFGIEKKVAHWFAFSLELNLQQWHDQSPLLENKQEFGLGIGIMSYYRWYLFGRKRLSPYLEYGTGLFQGFEPFPANGSNFTFNHSTQLGIEYTLNNKNRLRLGYGQFHQSNNGLHELNPGYDANGFSIHYSWFWVKKNH